MTRPPPDGSSVSGNPVSFRSSELPLSLDIRSYFPQSMTKTNYLPWAAQFRRILFIHDLSFVIDPNFSPPPASPPTPAYNAWIKADSLVLIWIMATVSLPIQSMLISCVSSREDWILLQKRLAPNLKAIRDQLWALKKTPDQTMEDYLFHAESLSNSMAAVGSPLTDSDLQLCVLEGLGHDFKGFISSMSSRSSTTFDELYELLIQEDAFIGKRCPLSSPSNPSLTATTTSNIINNNARGRGRGRFPHTYPSIVSVPSPPRPFKPSPSAPTQPSLLTPSSINSLVECQICNCLGHTAMTCFDRFNIPLAAQSTVDAMPSLNLNLNSSRQCTGWC